MESFLQPEKGYSHMLGDRSTGCQSLHRSDHFVGFPQEYPSMPVPASSHRALITGITGQDGSYLAGLLLEKGYEVHGVIRRASTFNTSRLEHLYRDPHAHGTKLILHYGDLSDGQSLTNLVLDVEPDEIYNLAAQSHVRVSFDNPLYTVDVTADGALRVLEAARQLNKRKSVRVYQASSSEMFGDVREVPQTEATPFYPRSPYACAKVFAFHQTVNYREAYDLFACNGILFNHESPRRGETFVTRKITRAATRIKEGLQEKLFLGNLDSKRDWGYAKEYVEAMWLMLQAEEPGDYVVATNEMHTIREFLTLAFQHLDLDWEDHVEIDPHYFRPTEVDVLLGDYSKARDLLGWEPQTTFSGLVQLMLEADWELAKAERFSKTYASARGEFVR
jgi:GDPmannose 4,6-dehydratase